MSNSKLVNYTKLSPNFNPRGKNKIKKITIHHMAGNLSVETCGKVFANPKRQASSNYGIGTDGRVGMYVEEKNRAWTSGNRENDYQAVTIEVANDKIGGNWHVSDVALAKLIDLCTDICKRNGIKKLIYTGDPNGNLTIHSMFQNTICCGPYLKSKLNYIADEVNKRLNPTPKTEWEKGKYQLLVAKYIRTSPEIRNNIVKVGGCYSTTRKILTSTNGSSNAKIKAGSIITISKTQKDNSNRVWGKYGNCYIVLCNKDGSPQAIKKD